MEARSLYGPSPEEPEPLRPVHDMRGTPVDDVEGRYTGEIYGALADADHGLIRYLDLALADTETHILVPLGHAQLERGVTGRNRFRLRAARREELYEIPPFEPGTVDLDDPYQRSILDAHQRAFDGEHYYAHPAYDHDALFAGEHPIERGPAARPGGRPLERLEQLEGFQVAEDEADIRGWPVQTREGTTAGTVRDLVIQPEAKKARYALITLGDGAQTRASEGRPVLVPVGFLAIEADEETVRTPRLEEDDLKTLPTHEDGTVDRDAEERVRSALDERLDGERRFDRADFFGSDPG